MKRAARPLRERNSCQSDDRGRIDELAAVDARRQCCGHARTERGRQNILSPVFRPRLPRQRGDYNYYASVNDFGLVGGASWPENRARSSSVACSVLDVGVTVALGLPVPIRRTLHPNCGVAVPFFCCFT